MTVRSFQRARARRSDRERRRASVLARRGRIVGLTLGASALFASSAQATTYQVQTTGDGPAAACTGASPRICTNLRDALTEANSDPAPPSTITFKNTVTGTITLTNGVLNISGTGDKTITGPGSGALAISGAHASQILHLTTTATSPVHDAISGLTLENGSTSASGGAVAQISKHIALALSDVTITGSASTGGDGGGLYGAGPVTLSGSTISGNTAARDGGGISLGDPSSGGSSRPYSDLTVTSSTISGNTATRGGGIAGASSGNSYGYETGGMVQLTGSHVTGNHATGSPGTAGGVDARFISLNIEGGDVTGNTAAKSGGGIFSITKYGTTIMGSTISGNSAASGGGGGVAMFDFPFKYSPFRVLNTTISGNQATDGAGIALGAVGPGEEARVQASTITGNHTTAGGYGGGIDVYGYVEGPVRLVDSTVSGNGATIGAGVSLGDGSHKKLFGKYHNYIPGSSRPDNGSVAFKNSTIASNAASTGGGGIYLGYYQKDNTSPKRSGTADIISTVVSGNKAHGAAEDLERAAGSTSGGFNGAFSLIQTPGTAPLTKQAVIVGADPQLGPLANNGGPTQTMRPSGTSPVIDQGHAAVGLTTDQRGLPRTVDTSIPNAQGGDGTDIGAVELAASSVVGINFKVSIGGHTLGSPGRPLIAGRATPVRCSVRASVISACILKVRVGGRLVASGSAANTHPKQQIFLRVRPTRYGFRLLKTHPLGLKATAFSTGNAPGSPTAAGPVRLLAGPWITLPIASRSPQLSGKVLSELDRAAGILTGVKRVTCTAYTDKGNGDVSLTKTQASAACKRLKSDGLKAKYRSVGGGSTAGGKRQLVISFKF